MAIERKPSEYYYYFAPIVSPDGPIRCDNCPVLKEYKRNECLLTREFPHDTRMHGRWCPLIKITKEEFYAAKLDPIGEG